MNTRLCGRLDIVYSQCLEQNLILQLLMHLKLIFINIYVKIYQSWHADFRYLKSLTPQLEHMFYTVFCLFHKQIILLYWRGWAILILITWVKNIDNIEVLNKPHEKQKNKLSFQCYLTQKVSGLAVVLVIEIDYNLKGDSIKIWLVAQPCVYISLGHVCHGLNKHQMINLSWNEIL